MPNTIRRRFSDTVRIRNFDSAARRWIAVGLIVLSAVSAYLVLGRDVDWRTRAREARLLGLTAENNGNHKPARQYYETALANDPYDWETHLSLANLLNHFLDDNENALRHYLYALAYSPNASIVEDTEREIAILRLIRAGDLENPLDALEDMFQAVESGAMNVFRGRLALGLRDDFMEYWRGWNRRGRGEVTFCRIVSERDGFFDAMVEMDFPDGTSMSIHLISPLDDIWRLELGFP